MGGSQYGVKWLLVIKKEKEKEVQKIITEKIAAVGPIYPVLSRIN